MTTIVTRIGKGAPLTNAELDANFSNLNADKLEASDLSPYLLSASAASTYQTISGMSAYLTTSSASSTYLTQANAASTYQTQSGMSSYLLSATAASTYQTQAGMSSYLTTASASSTYQTQAGMSSYLTTSAAASSYQPLDGDLTSIAGLAGTSGILKKTAANTWALDTTTYLDTTTAASTYQTQSGMSAYLTTSTASSTYLTQSSAASTYQTQSGMSSYLTTASASSTYLTQASAASTYQTQSGMSSYLTSATAASTYLALAGGTMTAALRLQGAGADTVPALATTVLTNEIHAQQSGTGSDYGFLRISAGGGTASGTKAAIDIQGYGTTDGSQVRIYTAGTERLRVNTDGAAIHYDNALTRAMLKDTGYTYYNSGTTNALDYTNGSHQRWAPSTGAQTLSITNWPPTGNLGELLIEGVNLAAATITWPTINWVKSDGTTTTTFSSNGVTLQTSGTDFVLLWTRDAGTTIYGKVVR